MKGKIGEINSGGKVSLKRTLFILIPMLSLAGSSFSSEIFIQTDSVINRCSDESYFGKPTIRNLIDEDFCLNKVELRDEITQNEIQQRIGKLIESTLGEYKDVNWEIANIYNVVDFDEIFIFCLNNPAYAHDYLEIVHIKSQDKFYILYKINLHDLGSVLGPLQFRYGNEEAMMNVNGIDQYSILKYCRMFSILNSFPYHINFISSMNELFMDEYYRPFTVVTLADTIYYKKLQISFPTVRMDNNQIYAKYCMAKDNKIVDVEIVMREKYVVEYNETIIGEIPDWYIGIR